MDKEKQNIVEESGLFQEQPTPKGKPTPAITRKEGKPSSPEPTEKSDDSRRPTPETDQRDLPDKSDPLSALLSARRKEDLEGILQNQRSEHLTDKGFRGLKEELSLTSKIEAILFASPTPVRISEIRELLLDNPPETKRILSAIEGLMLSYREKGGGIHIIHQKGLGYQFQTVPAASTLMEAMFAKRPRPLSRAAHETLAIVAYRQPVTRADIEFIRGVDAGSIIKNLLERELVACVGRKEDCPGKPMLFGTTDQFLRVYRLNSLQDLPPLESFQPEQDTIGKALDKIEAKHNVSIEGLIQHNENDTNPHSSAYKG